MGPSTDPRSYPGSCRASTPLLFYSWCLSARRPVYTAYSSGSRASFLLGAHGSGRQGCSYGPDSKPASPGCCPSCSYGPATKPEQGFQSIESESPIGFSTPLQCCRGLFSCQCRIPRLFSTAASRSHVSFTGSFAPARVYQA